MHLYLSNARGGGKFHIRRGLVLALTAVISAASSPLPSRPAVERELANLASHDYRVRPDPALHKLARAHAGDVLTDFGSASIDRVKAGFYEEGLADAQVLPFAAVGEALEPLLVRARAFARHQANPRSPTHIGVAWQRKGAQWSVVVLYSRRLVELAPLPRRLPRRGLTVRGVSRAKERMKAYLLGPCRTTCAASALLPVKQTKRRLDVDIPPPEARGHYVFQLVREGARGPEVTAQWTFRHGRGGRRWPPPPARVESTDQAAAKLVDQARSEGERAPLERDERLDRAAQAHAEAMCSSHITAHRLPGGPGPEERARAAGYEGVIHENVARAQTVGLAHRNLMTSPSHWANVMNPAAHHLGIGVAHAKSEDGVAAGRCLVQLFGYQR